MVGGRTDLTGLSIHSRVRCPQPPFRLVRGPGWLAISNMRSLLRQSPEGRPSVVEEWLRGRVATLPSGPVTSGLVGVSGTMTG
jgi:hypothetical protein